jgi:SpoIID/LytB domain protein
VRQIRIVGSRESVRFTGGKNISMVLGHPRLGELLSTFFVLEMEHASRSPHAITSVTIRGGGYGHGVGMCQMGAYMMGKRGYSYRQILHHYYPETSVRKAY